MAKRLELYYGAGGTGKSEAALRVIKLMNEATGKKARVFLGDGSQATYDDSGLVDAGIIETLDFGARDWPTSTLNQLAEGWWPADPQDPKSPLIAPTPASIANIGVLVGEGLSVGGLYIMGDSKGGLAYRAARGEKIGTEVSYRYIDGETDALGNFKDNKDHTNGPGMAFGANGLAHYGAAQKRILGVVERSKSVPVDYMIWTAHERAAEDKLTKETIVGPEVAGGALTANMQRHFNNTLHFVTAEKRGKETDEFSLKLITDLDVVYRIYTRDHFSPQGTVQIKFKACTRGMAAGNGPIYDKTGKLISDDDTMPLFFTGARPGDAIEAFYARLKGIRARRAEAAIAAMAARTPVVAA